MDRSARTASTSQLVPFSTPSQGRAFALTFAVVSSELRVRRSFVLRYRKTETDQPHSRKPLLVGVFGCLERAGDLDFHR